ncbi:Ig-like domain-containing protein [Spirosoma flavum]|uniref:SdrD B-like domain-containing protein n=1 Tax=Spirosoma flavum TaxID=2048557 RepID=A0ABW6AQU8_9BACT
MNEQLILEKSLHEYSCQTVSDTGRLTTPIRKQVWVALTLLLLWLVSSPVQAQTPSTINLSLHEAISSQVPAIGDVVSYTIVVANSPGSTTATTISIKDELPAGGVIYIPGSASIVRGNGTYTSAISTSAITGVWNITSIAPGDSAVLVLSATVNQRGVWFNTAEVVSADQTDSNSIPNNQSLVEDDYTTVCFSVPILWYVGDEYTVTIPSGYDQVVWYRGDTPISSSAVSTSLAEVNSDFSLTIKSPGVYRFVSYRTGCPATNCCNIEVKQGPYGSLGDYVFIDINKNGAQDTGEAGIDGVNVYLYNQTGATKLDSAVTAGGGKYLFDSLTDGSYVVQFISPTGYQSTTANAAGVADNADSDAGVKGFTSAYTIDTSQLETSTARTNLTVDAGFYLTCPTDFSLVVSSDQTICTNDSIKLTASTPIAGAKVRWYLTQYEGTPFATLDSDAKVVVKPATTTTYYVEVTTTDGCKSVRKPVVITVVTVSAPVIIASTKNACPATTVDLTKLEIENAVTGLTYEWYTSIDRSDVTRVTNLTAVGAGKFYLFARSGNCYSSPAVLTSEIVDCNCQNPASVTANPGLTICVGDAIPLEAVISGSATSVHWSTGTDGIFSAPGSLTTTYTPSTADIAAGSVLLTVTTNDPDGLCPAATYALLAKINKQPDAPTNLAGDDTLVCQGRSTKLVGFSPTADTKINWYDQDGNLVGTTLSGDKLVVTPSKVGAIIYTAESFTDAGCVSTRSSLTLTVGKCLNNLADLAVVKQLLTPGPYSVGQTITYAITVTNKGPVTASNVNVSEVLPATLTYVSSTPADQYSPTTSVWAIGLLNVGSSRNLLVETVIKVAGSIKNTAIVNSPDNDPTYSQNDTSSVIIPINGCGSQPPTILCTITEICKGGTTTLSATGCESGTVIWSNGKSGLIIFATPSITTTYTASCVVGQCTSGSSNSITVTVLDPKAPTITASADNVCPGTPLTLTASGCSGGVIEWSEKAQTGTSIVVTPYDKTTYTAQCRMGNCLSSPAQKTINITTDIPAPTIVCSTTTVCPGETVKLTVVGCVGTPVWNSTTATTTSIIVTPTLGNNSYTVYCKSDACVSKSSTVYTINIVAPVIPTITVSADTVCVKGSVVLTAADCNGTVVWNVAGQTGPSITVYPTASISYFAQCKYRTCLSAPSNTVVITVVSSAAPIISVSSTSICSGQKVTLTASGCAGTVQWHGIDRVGASIDIYPTATTEFYATCQQGSCQSEPSNKIRVVVSTSTGKAPVVIASSLAICNSGLVSLTATGCEGGTVKWSDGQSGALVSVSPTPTNHSFYALCQSAGSTQCGTAQSNVITIDVTKTPTPTIVRCLCSADTVCPGEPVRFTVKDCSGTPYWSTGESTTSIIVSPTVTTGYSVYCQNGVCKSVSTEPYTITVIPVGIPTLIASATSVAPGGTVTLTASGCNGTVSWSANDINGNNQGASLVMRPVGTQTYYAQCRFRECLSDPSLTITINPGDCSAKAGTLAAINGTVCGSSSTTVTVAATLNGGLVQPTGYSILYVLTKGVEKVVQQTNTKPQFNVSSKGGDYTIHTLVYAANPSDKNYLNLAAVKLNSTTATDIQLLIGTKCADLDTTGAKVTVCADTTTRHASRIGLAKSVLGQPQAVSDSLIKVSYRFVVTNFGDDTLRHVQVGDDLAYAFVPNRVQSAVVTANNSSLKINPAFTGINGSTQLLDTTSYLLPGVSQTFTLAVTVNRTVGDTTKSFNNIATASAQTSLTTVSDLSTSGGDPDPDNDGNPTNNMGFTRFTLGVGSPTGPSLGLALAVVKVKQQPDSSYNVTYKATIGNFGDVALKGVVLTNNLLQVFSSPASYSVVGKPVVGIGSSLVVNAGFDGATQPNLLTNASQLAVGAQDTVLITINIKPNGNPGPFYSSATVVGFTPDLSQTVEDISNNGFDPAPAGSVATTVRFDLPSGLMGVAKSVGTPTLVSLGVYDIPYTITLRNMGILPLKRVQVVDNLAETFGHGALIVSNRIRVTSTGSVRVDSLYTGQGLLTHLLVDSLSSLAVGATSQLHFTVRVDVSHADSLTFFNTAQATALSPKGEIVEDISMAGINNDPDNDLDPRNNSQPTPVALNGLATSSFLGLAMSVADTARQTDGSFNVTYQIVLTNYGPQALTRVSLSDTLARVFSRQTGATYSIVRAPFTSSSGSALKLNPAFNGGTDPVLVLGETSSSLAAGKTDTLRLVINVATDGHTTTFLNSAYGQALAPSGPVSDVSTSGLNPDLNGNGNPTDSNEGEATVLNLPAIYQTLFIPEGFSPNGDGVNDQFVIRGTAGLTISVEIYNRWGSLVYKNDDYHNDWDSRPNTGLSLSSDGAGVPDGTYYYVIHTSDGRQFVRYLTINR